MKKTFDGPVGRVEYCLERTSLYNTRRIIVDDETVGVLEVTASQKWIVVGLLDSRLFPSQELAAEYWLMWLALEERSGCPYCSTPWISDPVFVDQDDMSSVVWRCVECGAMEEHKRWPPREREEQ